MRAPLVAATLLAVASIAPAGAQNVVHAWTIDPNHTAAQFAVRHLLVSTVRGQFDKVTGALQWDGSDLRTLSIQVTIEAASVNTRVVMRDNDLRSANFFEVDKYPAITFTSTRVEPVSQGRFRIIGNLTIRGVTRELALEAEGPSPQLRQGPMIRVGASATTRIDRRDFGLLYNRVVEGAAVVGDEVTITIDIEATRRG